MKFTTIVASLALFSSLTVAADTTNVKSIIKSFFPSQTPTLAASKSTALASALVSHQSTWDNSPLQTSVNNAIFSAAPSSVSKSYASSGYYYDQVVTASWFTKSVPAALQTAVQNEIKEFNAVVTSIIGTSTSKAGAAAARATEAAVVGAVGVMGVVMAML